MRVTPAISFLPVIATHSSLHLLWACSPPSSALISSTSRSRLVLPRILNNVFIESRTTFMDIRCVQYWCWECLFKEKNIDDIDEGEVSIANGP